jgi:nitrogen-specific signal transduction histidine kinase
MNSQTPSFDGKSLQPSFQDHSKQFATALAYEVRHPLTNIKLSGEILSSVVKESDSKKYIDIISRNVTRIEILLNELLVVHGPRDMIKTFSPQLMEASNY